MKGPIVGVLALLCLTLLSCAGCERRTAPGAAPSAEAAGSAQIDLFVLGRVLGTVAPCGCTTEPLGGLAYFFGGIAAHGRPGRTLVIEPGSFLFPGAGAAELPTDADAWAQAQQRAEILHRRFAALGEHGLVSGIGPTDVGAPEGAAALARFPAPRVLANRDPTASGFATVPHRIVDVRGGETTTVRIGITSVVDPELAGADELGPLQPPIAAAAAAISAMRSAGAQLVVVIAHGPRAFAERVARETTGVDLVAVGVVEGTERQRLGSPAVRIGEAWLVEPGEQLQTATHLAVRFVGAGPAPATSWTVVPAASVAREQLARVEERLRRFTAEAGADPAFVKNLEAERDALRARAEGSGDPVGTEVSFEQLKITCRLPVDEDGKQALAEYDQWVATHNRERFAGVKTPAPPRGKPGYVGVETCDACHDEAVALWRKTRHAHAYETLEHDNKQYDLSCVGCHVTGFREPGGAEVVEHEGLESVQCETCHGPGSIHADTPERGGKPNAIVREAPATVCARCHTPDHSDTFAYEAYLRDVLGPGHGAAARARLGPGPTGRELRAAGLAKAGGSCKAM